jgi:diguanylate cyclase (GGDEF)-like protein
MTPKNLILLTIASSGCMTAFFAFFALKRRKSSGALAFSGLMASMTVYSWAYAVELTQTTVAGIKLCLMVEYVGISALPAFLIVHSFRYTGKDKWLRPSLYAALVLFSLCTLALNITNDFHHFFYRDISFTVIQGLSVAQLQKGPWYWVHIIYLNAGILSVNILFLDMFIRGQSHYRKQAATMLLGTLIPWIALITYLGGYSPYGIDPLPIAFGLMGPVLGLNMFRFRLLDIVPIARHFVFESMRDPVLVLDNRNRIADYNHAAINLFTSLPKKIIGSYAADVMAEYQELVNIIHSGTEQQIEIMADSVHNPRYFQASVTSIATPGKLPVGRILTLADITRQTLLRKKLEELATTDELTGVFNRRYFMEKGISEMKRAERNLRPVSVIMMDIDHFKHINDTFGHTTGDIVLRNIVKACSSGLRNTDLFARWGGEEFVMMLPETTPGDSLLIAERLRQIIASSTIQCEPGTVTVTASFGVCGIIKTEGTTLDDMIQKADKALYRAKAEGRNRVECM